MKITFYGHACFSVETAGVRLLFDPFIEGNSAAKQAGVCADDLKADYVLLSHGHEDHVADAEGIVKRTGATLIANYEVATWFGTRGCENIIPMNHGGCLELPFGSVKMVNAVHSSQLPDGSYGGNPAGFVIQSDEGTFYYSGDTALHLDMKMLGELTQCDWAALCIGDHFTMGVEDALRAAEWIGVKKVMGVHYDTFEPIKIDHQAAQKTFAQGGVDLLLPSIGESIII